MFDGDERRVMLRTRFLVHSVLILAFYNLIYRFQAESLSLPRRLNERRLSAMLVVFGMRKFDHGSQATTVQGIFRQAVYFHECCVDTQLQRPWTKASSALHTVRDVYLNWLDIIYSVQS